MENVDLEEGKIRVKGQWLTEDEIRYAIRMKVDSDDYNVADLAVALKTLITEMNKSTVLRVRVPKELAEKLEEISKERDESVESLLRIILLDFINQEAKQKQKFESIISEGEEEETPIELEAEIVEIIRESEEIKREFDGDERDLDILNNEEDKNLKSELLDLETSSLDSEPEKVQIEGNLEEDDFSDIDSLDAEIEEGLKELEPAPKPKKNTQKRVLRRKKVKSKRH
jgi:predicted transcriptional regulator